MSFVLTTTPYPEHVQIDSNIIYQETPEMYVVMNMETKNLEYISKPISYVSYNYMLKLGLIYYREIAKSSQLKLSEVMQTCELQKDEMRRICENEKNELVQENTRLKRCLHRSVKNNKTLIQKVHSMRKQYSLPEHEEIVQQFYVDCGGCVIYPYRWIQYIDDSITFGSNEEDGSTQEPMPLHYDEDCKEEDFIFGAIE
jgi:hypothetical protein